MKPYLILVATVAIAACAPAHAAPQADEPTGPATKPASAADVDPLKLLPGPDLTEEEETNRGELQSALRAAKEPLDQAAADAALANWQLSVPTARPVTRWLIGVSTPEDRKAIADSAKAAQTHLAAARDLLKKQDSTTSSDKSRAKKLSASIRCLQAFATAMIAIDSQDDDKARQKAWSEAASTLAESRESNDAALASAATLWQAIAWEQAGRRERALSVLPGALVKPEQEADFPARILRCRILSDAGQNTAALALLAQIRARVGEWYGHESVTRLRSRQRLVGLLELAIGRQWAKKLAATQPANAESLDELLADVRTRLFASPTPAVYVLDEAMPVVVKPPEVKPVATESNEKPVTQPASAPSKPDEPTPDQPKADE